MSQWQDIGTAPKDLDVLLFDGTFVIIGSWVSYPIMGTDRGDWAASFDCDHQWDGAPTHWMPLPPAPTAHDERPVNGGAR